MWVCLIAVFQTQFYIQNCKSYNMQRIILKKTQTKKRLTIEQNHANFIPLTYWYKEVPWGLHNSHFTTSMLSLFIENSSQTLICGELDTVSFISIHCIVCINFFPEKLVLYKVWLGFFRCTWNQLGRELHYIYSRK